ncbi:MAG: enoyl-CoA hydratase/isomerase family protein [Halobacteriovoraceae bacterium]|nr:enoyl-CoA hydratase/isomerase family protein [Halobacteriovoraceae bacterium]MCB9093853.1 enoyl-CoA hydratase/isomerase family protein [Halobacteriovoraceae bacterium]
MTSHSYIIYEVKESIARVTFNRPDVHNAFDDQFISELTETLKKIHEDKSLRLVVLASNGKSFCAGADLNWMKKMKDYSLEKNYKDSEKLSNMFECFDQLELPILGIVQGHALGGGVGIVSVCDYVLANQKAKFGFTEVRLGLVPSVISPYVLRKIGESQARAWFFSGEVFDAEKAKEMDLVHEVCSPDKLESRTGELVESFLRAGPASARGCKKLLKNVKELLVSDKEKLKDYTVKTISEFRISGEGQEGMTALLEKRTAKWVQK